MNNKSLSKIYIIEENISEKIEKIPSQSDYSIKIQNFQPDLPHELVKEVSQDWKDFESKNKNEAKDQITYFFSSYNKNENTDYVFPNSFRYVQAFGRNSTFSKYSCVVAANRLTALSSLCLVITKDNKLVFGKKTNMDNKISGFSGYISASFVIDEQIDIYSYLAASIQMELKIKEEYISNIVRIGQTYSPDIVDRNQKLNNKVYNNVFIIQLNICSNDVKRLFKESFQFKEIYMIDCNDMELLTFFRGKQSMVSIHCLAAVYLLFIYVKQNSTAINFIQSLSHTIISARNAKKNIGTTVEIIKQLNIFQWGLIGNDQIKHYSIAPMMWEKLFTLLDYPVNYFVINESDSIQMKKKLSSLISDDAFIGANIAMPWKQLAFEHSDKIEEETKPSKVVNTLVLDQSLIKGYNTDGLGMIHALEQKDALTDKNVLLMGAGGAAQTLPYHLLNRNIQSLFICDIEHEKAIQLVNNNKFLYQKRSVTIEAISHNNITEISKDIDIIINATPCGMLNYHSDMPFCKTLFEDFKPMIVIGEMVYNPYETMLIKEAKKRNFIVSEGVNMLVEQAALSFYYGFGVVLNDGHKREMKETAIRYLI